ncbi:MAG: S-layer homology domain-containing protein [Armatimonadetes bacterium]|nr:S-layer homology domain-containing protein [Armatimonadota bacterium]
MKKALFATVALALTTAPVLAQDGPFKDVPNDHWAYQAIDKLAQLKIILGDPDGLYHGKRTLTRYEMAVMLARMLDILDQRYALKAHEHGGNTPDMSNFATKADLNAVKGMIGKGGDTPDMSNFATKGDLANLVKKSDLDLIRKMVAEFQTELTTLGVDVDAIKKRLKNVEDRVSKLEDQWNKRLKINGGFNTYVRGNFREDGTSAFRDRDGFFVTGGPGTSGSVLADTRALHDLDLNLKATPNDNTTFEANLTVGNYLPYLGGGFGARSDRGGARVNQDQATTLWSAHMSTGVSLPILGSTGVTVGRIPTQFGAYTFKTPDQDSYFTNQKTDNGSIPTDGFRGNFRIQGINFTTQAGKVNPVNYGFGSANLAPMVMAGAFRGGYVGGLTRANTVGVFGQSGRVGGMNVNQFAGGTANFNVNVLTKFNINASYLTFGGAAQSATAGAPANFDTVNVMAADVSTRLLGITLVGKYAKSDTLIGSKNVTTKNNEALDVNGQFGRGNFILSGGYRNVGPYFGAPGAWARVGSFQNPTDIKGAYGKASWNPTNRIELMGSVQDYQGTGKATGLGGLTTNDKIANIGFGAKWQVTGPSSLEVSTESTTYTRAGSGLKPRELFTNIGYRFDFNSASTFRLLYQVADYNGKGNSAFNGSSAGTDNIQKGGVVAGQFSVKF